MPREVGKYYYLTLGFLSFPMIRMKASAIIESKGEVSEREKFIKTSKQARNNKQTKITQPPPN